MLPKFRISSPRPPPARRLLPSVFFNSNSKPTEDQTLITQQQQEEDDAIFHIINSSPSPSSMIASLQSLSIPLSNSIVDRVLKRARFSHGNPLKSLDFFVFAATQPSFSHTPFSYDTILYILGRARRFPETWNLLREMKRRDRTLITARTIQIVLGRIAKVCSVRQTVESFHRFRRLSPDFNADCFNALLRTLCQEKSMRDARNVYHGLKREFRPDLRTFNILLSGWKSPEEAEGFFGEMAELGVKPDRVSFNCLIDVYCKNREMDKAYKVFDEMSGKDFAPDVFTYTSIIGGLGLVGQPDKARAVLSEMREMGCPPDAAAYNAAIRNYCVAKRLGNAFALMAEMGERGLGPNPTSYNLFFRCFYWANELESSWRLYRRMRREKCLPNTQSCMFLVRLCRRQEKAGLAMELWNDMVRYGFGSLVLVSDVLFDLLCDLGRLDEAERCLVLVSDVLFDLLCDLGRLDEAERCFVEMIEMGQKPSSVSFRRIRALMEVGKREDSIRNLEEKMGGFGNVVGDVGRVESSLEMDHYGFMNL